MEGEVHPDVADAERGLAETVEAVMDRLEGFDVPEVGAFRQDRAAITGATEQERRLCEWSARLGIDPFDPEELTDELAETLRSGRWRPSRGGTKTGKLTATQTSFGAQHIGYHRPAPALNARRIRSGAATVRWG